MSLPNLMHLHTKASSVNVDGDEKDLVIAKLKELRRGTRVIHQQITIIYTGNKTMSLFCEAPNDIDLRGTYGSSGKISNETMLYRDLNKAATEAFPGNQVTLLSVHDILKNRLFVGLYFLNNYNFNANVCTKLGQAFLTGLINDTIGTRCYVPVQSVARMPPFQRKAEVYVTLANEGDCASHRLVGNEL